MGLQEELNELKLHDKLEELDAFIQENARDPKLIPGAEMRLLPFFLLANDDQFELTPANKLDTDDVAEIIFEATGIQPWKVRFLSLSEELRRLRDGAGDQLQARIGVGLSISTLIALISDHGDDFYHINPDNRWKPPTFCTALRQKLDDCLLDHLLPTLDTELLPLIDAVIGRDVPGIYRNALAFYLGFTLAGDAVRSARLRRFVTLLTCAIPLGEDRDEPGTWVVLTA